MKNAYDKLRQRKQDLKEHYGDKFNRADRIASLVIDDEIISEVECCLHSNDKTHVLEGMSFLKGLLMGRDLSVLPKSFCIQFIDSIPRMVQSNHKSIVYSALEWFVMLRENYPTYRETMLGLLKSVDVGEREFALNHYNTFAKSGEIEPLLSFELDTYACQMGHAGDWEYELRDKAFLLIEVYSNKNFSKIKCKESFEAAEVSWLDWSFFKIKN